MQLSEHFTLEELTHTDTGIENTPDEAVIDSLKRVCSVLERVRALLGVPLHVNSGYRSHAVNVAVHGSETSAHSFGCAADVVPEGLDIVKAFQKLKLCEEIREFTDQIIFEQKGTRGGHVQWIHIGLPKPGTEARHQALVFSPKTLGHYVPFHTSYVV